MSVNKRKITKILSCLLPSLLFLCVAAGIIYTCNENCTNETEFEKRRKNFPCMLEKHSFATMNFELTSHLFIPVPPKGIIIPQFENTLVNTDKKMTIYIERVEYSTNNNKSPKTLCIGSLRHQSTLCNEIKSNKLLIFTDFVNGHNLDTVIQFEIQPDYLTMNVLVCVEDSINIT